MATVEAALNGIEGVESVEMKITGAMVEVQAGEVEPAELEAAVQAAGYGVTCVEPQ